MGCQLPNPEEGVHWGGAACAGCLKPLEHSRHDQQVTTGPIPKPKLEDHTWGDGGDEVYSHLRDVKGNLHQTLEDRRQAKLQIHRVSTRDSSHPLQNTLQALT